MIAIVGCGTLGSRLAKELQGKDAILFDHDIVREHNVGVQLFDTADVGKPKASVLAERYGHTAVNSFVDVISLDLLQEAEVVCDCTDNLLSRKIIADYCRVNGIPFIHAAAAKNRGILAVFTGSFHFDCLYENKIAVDACRSTDIDLAMADRLAQLQAKKAIACYDHATPYLAMIQNNIRELNIPECKSKPTKPTKKQYYLTFCTQANCMSAKPLKRTTMHPQKKEVDGITVITQADGEILFQGSEDIDVLEQLADEIYNSK